MGFCNTIFLWENVKALKIYRISFIISWKFSVSEQTKKSRPILDGYRFLGLF